MRGQLGRRGRRGGGVGACRPARTLSHAGRDGRGRGRQRPPVRRGGEKDEHKGEYTGCAGRVCLLLLVVLACISGAAGKFSRNDLLR